MKKVRVKVATTISYIISVVYTFLQLGLMFTVVGFMTTVISNEPNYTMRSITMIVLMLFLVKFKIGSINNMVEYYYDDYKE